MRRYLFPRQRGDFRYVCIHRAAVATIERQIRKEQDPPWPARLRQDAFVRQPDVTSFAPEPEENTFEIVRTKRFPMKPMTHEEAILQMNLLDHTFFVFRNSEDDSLSIVYQRKNGGYGLIVTDEEE